MPKTYLRYSPSHVLSPLVSSCSLLIPHSPLICTASLFSVNVLIPRTLQILRTLGKDVQGQEHTQNNVQERALVTCMAVDGQGNVGTGYEDGTVRVFDLDTGTCRMTARGHGGAVAVVQWGKEGVLVSGGKDTDIVVWDTVAEVGVCRLKGHKGEITGIKVVGELIVSTSKDSFVKIWDLSLQACVQTLTGHAGEVWALAIANNRLVTGSDKLIRVWDWREKIVADVQSNKRLKNNSQMAVSDSLEEKVDFTFATYLGSFERAFDARVLNIEFSGKFLFCLCSKGLEIFETRTEEQILKKRKRRVKRHRESNPEADFKDEYSVLDEFFACVPLRVRKMIHFSVSGNQILLTSSVHTLAIYRIDRETTEPDKLTSIATLDTSHPHGIRCLAVSHDNGVLASVSQERIKIWNIRSQKCIRTIDIVDGFGLCCAFVPGDRHLLIGTKEGDIHLYEISSGERIFMEKAHPGSIGCLDLFPDRRGFATGGAGKEVKFWEFELSDQKTLQFFLARTLQLTDDAVAIKHSPDSKLLAVSLLDSTIKLFFNDSLKFFLSLYGHKLPASTIDISSDSTLLISGSADKNVKIWGLDFGDCHRSIFAHHDSILQTRFVPNTHHFFSVSKDKLLKYWDADSFNQILSLPGHASEIWALAISSLGEVFTAGADCSIRFWQETQEQVFLDEEKENAIESMFEMGLHAENAKKPSVLPGSGLLTDEQLPAASKATKASLESIKSGERLMDFIDIAFAEKAKWDEYYESLEMYEMELKKSADDTKQVSVLKKFGLEDAEHIIRKPVPPPGNPLVLGKTWDKFMSTMFITIKSTDLEEALLVMPFDYVVKFLTFLSICIEEGFHIEIATRALLFLLRVHQKQIIANQSLTEMLQKARKNLSFRLMLQKDEYGFNLAALKHLEYDIKSEFTSIPSQ